jgi:sucrose-phosphate synthase
LINHPLRILLISVHGLVRGTQMELGRDADTGGQVKYVVELARALGAHPAVEQVDLITRMVEDSTIDITYRAEEEELSSHARIVRLPFGPRRYLRKEVLWPHLDQMVDRCLAWLRAQPRLPDVIHSHYADAGYVGQQLSLLLGIPLVHTAHSLGREKRSRLIEAGRNAATIDKQFNFNRRIYEEERTLEQASLVIGSTRQELTNQYAAYKGFAARRAAVVPPGVDLERFTPPGFWDTFENSETRALLRPFLVAPRKPIILTLSRPDTRKNVSTLLTVYAQSSMLRELANLVIIAGNREDIREADDEARKFFMDLLLDIDRYDLYGNVAIPKHHKPEQVPEIYRYAARSRGVLVNPGLNENFGLTLIEAAASGLPVIATTQGGPQEIIANCRNGILIDPLDQRAINDALLKCLSDRELWRRFSRNGLTGAERHYTWAAHADKYLNAVNKVLRRERKRVRRPKVGMLPAGETAPLTTAKKLIVTDLDNTLIGDDAALERFMHWLRKHSDSVAMGVATGRTLESALKLLRDHDVPVPDVVVTSVGTDIRYGEHLLQDNGWENLIRYNWRPDALRTLLDAHPDLEPQARSNFSQYKLSYLTDPNKTLALGRLYTQLHEAGLRAHLVHSHGRYLDVLPVRASKGRAVRYLAYKWGLRVDDILVAGDSGNDMDMLSGDTLGVVVGGYRKELNALSGTQNVYFADQPFAQGILEGIEHYAFG